MFSSKENIVAYILSKEYAFNPSDECNCCGRPTLKQLSKGFTSFIVQKADFIELLEKNNIIYLMQETLYDSFSCCGGEDNGKSLHDILPDTMTIDFMASGLTTIAKHYVKNRSHISNKDLEQIIYILFSGEYLNME